MSLTDNERKYIENLGSNLYQPRGGIDGGYLKVYPSLINNQSTISPTNETLSSDYWVAVKNKLLEGNPQVTGDFILYTPLFDKIKLSPLEKQTVQESVSFFISTYPAISIKNENAKKLSLIFPELEDQIMKASKVEGRKFGL